MPADSMNRLLLYPLLTGSGLLLGFLLTGDHIGSFTGAAIGYGIAVVANVRSR